MHFCAELQARNETNENEERFFEPRGKGIIAPRKMQPGATRVQLAGSTISI
jgi:hypothetical protein